VKTGDAKLWVCDQESGHDRQAAESHKTIFVLVGLAYQSQAFLSGGYISQGDPGWLWDCQKEKSHVP